MNHSINTLLIALSLLLLSVFAFSAEKEYAVIETEYGRMVIQFFDDLAPMHVESFKLHAKNGYFDGTTFHRVIPGFVIQGGDPNSKDNDRSNDGTGGHAAKLYHIWDTKKADTKEKALNDPDSWLLPQEFNSHSHKRGALSMARSNDPNSAGSQFFICVADVPRLDNKYTVFGEVIEGMDVADKIVNLETPRKKVPNYKSPDGDNPIQPCRMNVKITTKP